jgi:DNA-binding CsgD family transcriptional regulator
MWTYSLLAYVAIHRDDLRAARTILDAAAAAAHGRRPAMGRDQVLWCEALVLDAAADPGAAAELLEQAWKLPLAFKSVTRTRMGPDLVRLAVMTGNHPLGRAVAQYAERAAATTHLPLHQGVALRCAGLLQGDPATLERAVAALRASQRPVELAFACEDTAMALRRSGRPTEAVTLLHESINTYERVGAVRDAARADAALRALGVRRGRRGPRPRARMGWESLTRTEHDVVRLVAQGLTNAEIGVRLFISRRTVETHLSHVFRKLGLSSRVELAAQATRRAQ